MTDDGKKGDDNVDPKGKQKGKEKEPESGNGKKDAVKIEDIEGYKEKQKKIAPTAKCPNCSAPDGIIEVTGRALSKACTSCGHGW